MLATQQPDLQKFQHRVENSALKLFVYLVFIFYLSKIKYKVNTSMQAQGNRARLV